MKLVFATNNRHKLDEVRAIVGDRVEVLSLNDIGCYDDIPETADTLQGNALIKARYIHEKFGVDCFADDTGLEVEALDGAPGVFSARYAGEECDSEANMQKLLQNLTGKSNRNAQFRTVIALIIKGEEKLFNGIVKGGLLVASRVSRRAHEAPLGHDRNVAHAEVKEFVRGIVARAARTDN